MFQNRSSLARREQLHAQEHAAWQSRLARPDIHPSGIEVKSNAEWTLFTVVGITLMHFLWGPILVVMGLYLALCLALGVLPEVIIKAITHSPSLVPLYWALLIGGILLISLPLIYKGFRWIFRRTSYRYTNGYRGPLNPRQPNRTF